MVKYTFTEKDLEKLYDILSNGEASWWVEARIEEWKETLEQKNEYFCECEGKSLDYICPCVERN